MKKYTLLSVMLLMMSGCVGYRYIHKEYSPDGKTLKNFYLVEANKAMVNDMKRGLSIKLPDKATLTVGDVNTTDSPESAEAIGNAIAKGIKAYNGTDLVETIVDANK